MAWFRALAAWQVKEISAYHYYRRQTALAQEFLDEDGWEVGQSKKERLNNLWIDLHDYYLLQQDLVGTLLAWRRWLCNAVPAQNNKFPQFRLAAFNEFGDQLVLRHNGYGRTWGPSSLLKKTCFNINFAVNLGCTKRKSMWVTDWICLFLPHIPKIALKHQPGSCLWRSLEAHMSSLSVTRRCSPCKCRWVVWSWASSPWRTRVSRSRNSERWTNSWQTQRLHGPCLNVGDASGQLNFLVTMARGCH